MRNLYFIRGWSNCLNSEKSNRTELDEKVINSIINPNPTEM